MGTDWIGSDAYNLRLSTRRAESVRNWLAQAGGVPQPAVSTVGYGESRPIAPTARRRGTTIRRGGSATGGWDCW